MNRVALFASIVWAIALSKAHARNPIKAASNHVEHLIQSVTANYAAVVSRDKKTYPGHSRGGFKPLYIDCGSSTNFTDSRGNVWRSDRHFSNSSESHKACPKKFGSGTKAAGKVFCTWRSFPTSGPGYDIPLPPGSYNVTLYFAEYFKEKENERVFDISIEGGQRGSLDIIKATNVSKRACTVSVAVNVTDGSLTIEFFARAALPMISGISVRMLKSNHKNGWTNATKPRQWSNSTSGSPPQKSNNSSWKQKNPQAQPALSPVQAPKPAATQSFKPLYIDCGVSVDYTDSKGRVWKADAHYSESGQTYSECPMTVQNASIDEVMYCSERWFDTDNFADKAHGYEIPVPRGKYMVLLHFSENFYTIPEYRVFDVEVENGERHTVDIFKEAKGSQRAYVLRKTVTVLDDSLSINFFKVLEFPKIAAIEVHSVNSSQVSLVSSNFESIYIDCGSSDDFNDSRGYLWTADKYFSKSSQAHKECPVVVKNVTVDDEIYCSERWFDAAQEGPYAYEIPVPKGSYSVTLHFTENFYTKRGERVFEVAVEGGARVTKDIVEDADGPNRACTLSAQAQVSDGFLSILFFPLVEFPKVTAIEVHAAGHVQLSPLASSSGVQKQVYIRGLPHRQ